MRRPTLSLPGVSAWQRCLLFSTVVLIPACDRDVTTAPVTPVPAAAASVSGPIVVSSSAELIAALTPQNAGRRILVVAGSYATNQPLTVPDGATLEGEGVMLFDEAGLPTGFAPGTRTTLSMAATTPGNMLTLGDGVTIRGMEISDLTGRTGNVIAVLSRAPGDRVSATIIDSEIVNPNPLGPSTMAFEGPAGNGLVVVARNVNLGGDPLPHEGAEPAVRIIRSLVRSPAAGVGVFAFSYASHAKVTVTIDGSVIGGGLNANGGVSLPNAVHDSEVRITSRRNVFRYDGASPCASPQFGWNLTGGSGPPFPLVIPETARNMLRVHSAEDRIEGFARAVLATGGRRFFGLPIAGPSTDNSIELHLLGSTITTPSCPGSADLVLAGANAPFTDVLFPGDGNTVRAVLRGVTGSGQRLNRYGNATGLSGPLAPSLQGSTNRLEIIGSPQAFAQTNQRIEPPPPVVHFSSQLP